MAICLAGRNKERMTYDTNTQRNDRKYGSAKEELQDIVRTLTPAQMRYVLEAPRHKNKREAAKAAGVKAETVYRWPPEVDRAIDLIALSEVDAALAYRQTLLVKAINVKAEGLDSEDETIRQRAATEVIEWILGKATQKTEVESQTTVHVDGLKDILAKVYGGK